MWITEYRPHVYGFGFGAQLGLAVVTIVNTSAIYTWLVAGLLTGHPVAGAAVGAVFGVVRGAALLPSAWVTRADRLGLLSALVERLSPSVRRVALAGQGAVVLVATALVVA